MSYKFKAPADFRGTSFDIAGINHNVENGVIECAENIGHILAPFGFTRVIDEPQAENSPGPAILVDLGDYEPKAGQVEAVENFALAQEAETNIDQVQADPEPVAEVKKTTTKKTT